MLHLVDVVNFEVFQKQQQDGRDGLHDDLLVSIDINAKFHALQHRGPVESDITNQSPIYLNYSPMWLHVHTVRMS